VDKSTGVICNIILMRDQDDGMTTGMQFIQQCHDFHTGFAVQVSGWLVREDNGRAKH